MAVSRLQSLHLTQIPKLEDLSFQLEAEGGMDANSVGPLSARIALQLGVDARNAEIIRKVAPFHDIGMLYIPESITSSPRNLSPAEYAIIKTHVSLGMAMLQGGNSSHLRIAKIIIETHHERWNGSGYPYGLKGLRIPKVGQIVAVADVFSAMTQNRPYRQALSVAEATREILKQSDRLFDPSVVAAFEKAVISDTRPQQDEAILEGKMAVLGLYDLLNSLIQNGATGKLRIYNREEEGLILMYRGKLIHARISQTTGEEAMVRMLAASQTPDANFRLEPWDDQLAEEFQSIDTPTIHLMLSAAVKLDHQKR
ncbi:MAG: HD domain-containing protein [Trueperaceae bacterium]|nr:HD domain-containing protein [Trueperaceae bacterium]